MVRNYIKKRNRPDIPKDDLKKSIKAVLNRQMSIRIAASTFNIPKSTLYDRLKKLKSKKNLIDSGNESSSSDVDDSRLSKYATRQIFSPGEEKHTGLWPINSMIFNDDDFMRSFVTDRADPEVQMKQCELPSTSITYNNSMLLNDIVNRVTKPKAKILSVHIVRPLPKAGPRKTNGKSRLGKSRIYTNTPEKGRIQELETMRKQKLERKNTKRIILQSGGEVNKKDTKVREKGKGKAPKK
ncbi:hypothetical protein RN001_016416 [Aquatica leii]|uniref:HTH psq-type domain-containing protein n=1 Tax=Aquatica leii TaxID=1421715 RepID=A0AAN7NXP1_9COLE|nr:hypothetical protein RN001_016416 [Aquatica leii]